MIFWDGMDTFYIEFMKVIYDQPHKSRPPTSWGLCLAVHMYVS
jgi:hypothetical protein